jgi:glycosyltransferase involved in cell wall biosynthesis
MTTLIQAAKQLGINKAVDFIGALPTRHAVFESASKCDVGLAFMPMQGGDVNMANMAGASNKPFDYLACGLALMVTARPDWEEMFVDQGYGLCCDPDNADSIAKCLQWYLHHPAEMHEMGAIGRQRVLTQWNYDNQFDQVVRFMEQSKNPPEEL